VPLLCDELKKVGQLVSRCHFASANARKSELNRLLQNCDVLYVGGKHDQSLTRLKQLDVLDVTLAILNVCCSEKLARHLISKGVRAVTYWPTFVHDAEAVNFGIAFVRHLFGNRIEEAFHKAKQSVAVSERAPRLLSSRQQVPEQLRAVDVILELHHPAQVPLKSDSKQRRCKLAHVGKRARILPHTVMNGWVKVQMGDEVTSWRVGHWHLAPTAVRTKQHSMEAALLVPHTIVAMTPTLQTLEVDATAFDDTQPDTEEEDEVAGRACNVEDDRHAGKASVASRQNCQAVEGEQVEDTQYFLRCMTSSRNLVLSPQPVSPQLQRKRAADFDMVATEVARQASVVVPCGATQTEDCADTLLDAESQDQSQFCHRSEQLLIDARPEFETAKRQKQGT